MLLEDEAGFYRQPTMAPVWAPGGRRQPRVPWSAAANRPLRAAIGFDPVRGRLVHRLRSSFTAVEMGRFYRFMSQAWPAVERIVVVMDNWPVHRHPRAWAMLEADRRIQVLWLPTYAPWLNPAEKVWKWLRQKLVHMHPWSGHFTQLRARVDLTLASANNDPRALLRYTGTGYCKLYAS